MELSAASRQSEAPRYSAEITPRRENGRRRPRGYANWRPHSKTEALLSAVNEVIVEYEDFLPLSVRQIFYRLVAAHGYEKTEPAYKRLAEHLVMARRSRRIDFEVIRDDEIVTYPEEYYADQEAFWDTTGHRIRNYRRDRQEGQPVRIELWCEAKGMLEQLNRVASNYSVPVYSAGGFVSLTGTRLIARRALDRNVPTVLLHVGDLDPSGQSIFDSMAEDAAAFVEADRLIHNLTITAERVALTPEQVDRFGLPTAPPKKSDARSRSWTGETCQLEALAPDLIAEVVDDAIRSHLDRDRLGRVIEAEHFDQIALTRALPEVV